MLVLAVVLVLLDLPAMFVLLLHVREEVEVGEQQEEDDRIPDYYLKIIQFSQATMEAEVRKKEINPKRMYLLNILKDADFSETQKNLVMCTNFCSSRIHGFQMIWNLLVCW